MTTLLLPFLICVYLRSSAANMGFVALAKPQKIFNGRR